jgi:alpha-N-acetylglucosaminidase
MKRSAIVLLALITTTLTVRYGMAADTKDQAVPAARALLQRVLPAKAALFDLEWIPPEGGADVFEIEARDGRIVLRGTDGVALASALNTYLKQYCHAHLSWCGDQLV